jgi:hypothetical protein
MTESVNESSGLLSQEKAKREQCESEISELKKNLRKYGGDSDSMEKDLQKKILNLEQINYQKDQEVKSLNKTKNFFCLLTSFFFLLVLYLTA